MILHQLNRAKLPIYLAVVSVNTRPRPDSAITCYFLFLVASTTTTTTKSKTKTSKMEKKPAMCSLVKSRLRGRQRQDNSSSPSALMKIIFLIWNNLHVGSDDDDKNLQWLSCGDKSDNSRQLGDLVIEMLVVIFTCSGFENQNYLLIDIVQV